MKIFKIIGLYVGFSLVPVLAQENRELDAIKQQLKEANDAFEKAVQQHRQIIESLNKKLESLQPNQPAAPNAAAASKPPSTPSPAIAAAAAEAAAAAAAAVPPEASGPKWSPSQPMTLFKAGSAYMNVSFGALMDVGWSTASDPSARLQLGDHDPDPARLLHAQCRNRTGWSG